MDKKVLDILADAISDVGAWQWWHLENDMLQLEFRDVLLYDESKPENDTHIMYRRCICFCLLKLA